MHPDDVRERDIAWIKGPEPRLPALRQKNGGITSFIGFDGQLHRTPRHLHNSAEYLWALDSDNSFGYAAMARLELLLSWPEPGESLGRWIKVLEEALDRALGIGNPPADSKPPRGESEKAKRAAACKACREAPAQPGERFCVLCEKELMEDAKRQRAVLHYLSCYGYIAEAAVQRHVVGVVVHGRYNTTQSHYAGDIDTLPDGFLPLHRAEKFVRTIESDCAKQSTESDCQFGGSRGC